MSKNEYKQDAFKPQVKIVKYLRFTLDTTFDLPDGGTEKPVLRVSWRGNYPRFTVFTRNNIKDPDTGKVDYGKIITAPFDPWVLRLYLKQALVVLGKKVKGTSSSIDCYNTKYVKGERTNEKYLQATVKIGIDDDGVAYISVTEKGKDVIVFPLNRSLLMAFYDVKDQNGDSIKGDGAISRAHAIEYFEMLNEVVKKDILEARIVEYIDPPGTKTNKQFESKSKTPTYQVKPNTQVETKTVAAKTPTVTSTVSEEKDEDLDIDELF